MTLQSTLAAFMSRYSFLIEKKTVGRKEFETYLVKDLGVAQAEPPSGQNYIRVTHALGYWVPPRLKAFFQSNTKKQADQKLKISSFVGSKIHEYIETVFFKVEIVPALWVARQTRKIVERKQILHGINAFHQFWNGERYTLLAQELQIFSAKYGFAGTIDAVCVNEAGDVVLFDWKSGAYKAAHGWQLAAYALAFEEHFGIKPKLIALMLDKQKGVPTPIRYQHNDYLQACYLGLLQGFAGENWKALGEFWPWNLTKFHTI